MKRIGFWVSLALSVSCVAVAPRWVSPVALSQWIEKQVKLPVTLGKTTLSWEKVPSFQGGRVGPFTFESLSFESPLYLLPFQKKQLIEASNLQFREGHLLSLQIEKGLFWIEEKELSLFDEATLIGSIPIGKKRAAFSVELDPKTTRIPLQKGPFHKMATSSGKITVSPFAYRVPKIVRRMGKLIHPSGLGLKEVHIACAPTHFSLSNGQLFLADTEMLIQEKYSCTLVGSIDLLKEELDFTLEISANHLIHLFGIEGDLGDLTMKIPLKGPIHSFNLEKTLNELLLSYWGFDYPISTSLHR